MPESYQISDDSDLRKFRTELPNIIDDLGLNPYQRALYTHYKRVCGANGGKCTEGTRTTASKTKMSLGQVSTARNELANKGLIEKIESGQYIHIKITDIWELNFAYYAINERPSIDGLTIRQVTQTVKSVHTVNTLQGECSPGERSVHTVNTNRKKRSYSETKKEHESKKEPIERTLQQKIFLALADLCHIDLSLATDKQKGQLHQSGKVLAKAIDNPETFKDKFLVYWTNLDWRGQKGQAPTPTMVRECYGDFCHWLSNGEQLPAYKNGANQNGHQTQKEGSQQGRQAQAGNSPAALEHSNQQSGSLGRVSKGLGDALKARARTCGGST